MATPKQSHTHGCCLSSAKPRRSAAPIPRVRSQPISIRYTLKMFTLNVFALLMHCMMNLHCYKVCDCNIDQPVCVSSVMRDTYTFSTHAAGRIPGNHFNFDLLFFFQSQSVFFPRRQPLCPLYPALYPTAPHSLSMPLPLCLDVRMKIVSFTPKYQLY